MISAVHDTIQAKLCVTKRKTKNKWSGVSKTRVENCSEENISRFIYKEHSCVIFVVLSSCSGICLVCLFKQNKGFTQQWSVSTFLGSIMLLHRMPLIGLVFCLEPTWNAVRNFTYKNTFRGQKEL